MAGTSAIDTVSAERRGARASGPDGPAISRVDVAVLVKQVPVAEALALGADGRLVREGVPVELNAYCRRAITKGVELARETGGRCVAFCLGPPSAEEAIREAIAAGAGTGVLVSDPAFAGSDTLATARALAAALEREGPFDLVLAGLNSVDADTGQVGPEVAELLGLPFAGAVRRLERHPAGLRLFCERDDGSVELEVGLPAVLSVAERLCPPAKFGPQERAAVPETAIKRLLARDLGEGPWGAAGSPTRVGTVRANVHRRERLLLSGPLWEQVDRAVTVLVERGALWQASGIRPSSTVTVPGGGDRVRSVGGPDRSVIVVLEPGRNSIARELLGAAAELAASSGRSVIGVGTGEMDLEVLGSWGADEVVCLRGIGTRELGEEDVAWALSGLAEHEAWAVLAPSTSWGRQVASRAAARLGAGLTGDAVELELDGDRLVAWKPAFGGYLTVAIEALSPVQMATVRPGVLPVGEPRKIVATGRCVDVHASGRVRVISRTTDAGTAGVARSETIIGVGAGVAPELYDELLDLREVLGAELVATRKVTDQGWLPRNRQVGLTGLALSPRLYVVLGASGKFNHLVGVRGAGTVLAVNSDSEAPVFEGSDVGIVGDWREVTELLTARLRALRQQMAQAAGATGGSSVAPQQQRRRR